MIYFLIVILVLLHIILCYMKIYLNFSAILC